MEGTSEESCSVEFLEQTFNEAHAKVERGSLDVVKVHHRKISYI